MSANEKEFIIMVNVWRRYNKIKLLIKENSDLKLIVCSLKFDLSKTYAEINWLKKTLKKCLF